MKRSALSILGILFLTLSSYSQGCPQPSDYDVVVTPSVTPGEYDISLTLSGTSGADPYVLGLVVDLGDGNAPVPIGDTPLPYPQGGSPLTGVLYDDCEDITITMTFDGRCNGNPQSGVTLTHTFTTGGGTGQIFATDQGCGTFI